ncbi:MAG: YdcF family protein [Gemmatimonadaceae bacterium]
MRVPDLALYFPAAVIGGMIGPTRLRPLLWIGATPLAVVSLAVACTPLVRALGTPLIRRDEIPSHVDAIAALGTGLTADGLMKGETLDRLLSALELARRHPGTPIMVSRERRSYRGRAVSDSTDQTAITQLIRPDNEVLFVDSVFTTRSEALRMKEQAQKRGWSNIAVVTSPLHTRRACATFEAVGFKVVCVPAVRRDSGLLSDSNAEDRLRSFRSWLYESFATATYRSNHWMR